MRTAVALAAVLALLGASADAASADGPVTGDLGADAIWAWSWGDPDALADHVVANGLDRVYLYAEGGFGRSVRAAIAALGARGVAVEALGGERRWAIGERGGMLAFVRSARRYQRHAPADAELAGIHVDVEPHALRAWRRDERGTALALVRALRAGRRAAGPLPFAADIPFWFDGIRLGRGRGSLSAAVIAATDATTVMAYRDSGPAVIQVARREVGQAGRAGRETTVGVETGSAEPEQVTFAEEGRAALIAAIAAIGAAFGPRPGYAGVAIHHYGSLRGLRP